MEKSEKQIKVEEFIIIITEIIKQEMANTNEEQEVA